MLIEQISKFEMRKLGPPPKTGYFHDKTKISRGKSSTELLFTTKSIAESNVPCFYSPGPSQF